MTRLLYITLCTLALLLAGTTVFGDTLKVCKTCDYTSVTQAVRAAKAGDRVVVDGGVYNESLLTIDKPISLVGINNPVIDGNNTGQIITITSDGVRVQGFTLRNVATSHMKDDAAIRVIESSGVKILNNKVYDTYFGIYLQNAENCVIAGNVVKGQSVSETTSGNAIHLWYCENITIKNNHLEGHRDGIYLEFAKNSRIHHNFSQLNIRYGLHFMFSDGNMYTHNTFRKNGAGVAVMYTRNIVMEHNTFENNWGAAAYGLLLKDISQSVIRNNTFRQNTTGIYLEGSSRLHVENNDFDKNGWAMRLLSSCIQDTFRFNNFTGNSFDVGTNGNSRENFFEHNYWDNYTGYDLDKDRVGDVPYRPVSMYSMLVERVPPSVMFMRSFMVDLMDKVEIICLRLFS